MEKDLIEKKLELLDFLIDDRIDLYGINNMITLLLDGGFTKEEIISMNFDEEDIDYVLKNPDAEFEY